METVMNFGKGTSLYCARYLTPEREEELLTWCKDDVRFQIFNCTSQQRVVGGEPRLKAARVRPGGDLWREYNPLCRGGTGADPAVTDLDNERARARAM